VESKQINKSPFTETKFLELVKNLSNQKDFEDFIYTGDNNASSQWIMDNLIKFLHNTGNLEWGHNEDSTQYFFKINGTTLTKDKTSG